MPQFHKDDDGVWVDEFGNEPVLAKDEDIDADGNIIKVSSGVLVALQTIEGPASVPKKLDDVFYLEKHDPRHRMGNFLQILYEYYKGNKLGGARQVIPDKPTLLASSKLGQPKLSHRERPSFEFYQWCDHLDAETFAKAIKEGGLFGSKGAWPNDSVFWSRELHKFQQPLDYLNSSQRRRYYVYVEGGLLKRESEKGGKEFLSTTGHISKWTGSDTGIWVMGNEHSKETGYPLYAGIMKIGRFQHSSFLEGKKVLAAGEWKVGKNGQLLLVTGRSGHYKPDMGNLVAALKDLKFKKVDLSSAYVEVFAQGAEKPERFAAEEFIGNVKLHYLYRAAPNLA
ncbi:MAG: hypothetical protein FIA97_14365 [Methylococcaceae bacterium]|nr:hypothetical protein [Methylococcaceae bacterium]